MIQTLTGRSSRLPVAAGSRGVTFTSMVGDPEPPFCDEGVVATVPT